MRVSSCIGALALIATAGTTFGSVASINSVVVAPRIFDDFTTTTLNITNNYPSSINFYETGYVDDGTGGNYANKHGAWLSDDSGATKYDFDYSDAFSLTTTVKVENTTTGIENVEAGIYADLFGFGQFGVLTNNGEIAAFGSTLPFYTFGAGLYSIGDTITLNMKYRPRGTEFYNPASTMQYSYSINGGGWHTSGPVPFGNSELGIPSAFPQYFGVGVQLDNPIGGTADITFSNLSILDTPAPGAFALFGCAGLAGIRRRRR